MVYLVGLYFNEGESTLQGCLIESKANAWGEGWEPPCEPGDPSPWVSVGGQLPDVIKDNINSVLGSIPFMGGLGVNGIGWGKKTRSADCCDDNSLVQNGIFEEVLTGNIKLFAQDLPVFGLKGKEQMFTLGPYDFKAEASFAVTFSVDATGSGSYTKITNNCDPSKNCTGWSGGIGSDLSFNIKPSLVACASLNGGDCRGLNLTPVTVSASSGVSASATNECGGEFCVTGSYDNLDVKVTIKLGLLSTDVTWTPVEGNTVTLAGTCSS